MKIKIGVSSCVLGQSVRYDGGHKKSGFVAKKVADIFELVPICPEVGMGMPIPRPTIHLREFHQDDNIEIRLVDSKDGSIDHSDAMEHFYQSVHSRLAEMDGYIVAAKSPSCGMERIKVYTEHGDLLHRKGMGLYVAKMQAHFPNLPIEEDGRLNDQGLRESFFVRVMAHHEFRTQVLEQPSVRNLVAFHSRYKFLILACKEDIYRQLGRIVAQAARSELDSTLSEYQSLMMAALSRAVSRKKHTNVLMHLQGFFKKHLSQEEKRELSQSIEHFRLGYVPLLAPLTLLRHHLKRFPNPYLEQQAYLQPFPLELGLHA